VNKGGRRIQWSEPQGITESDSDKIPRMEADVLLDAPDRRIIVDAKFYQDPLLARGGGKKLRSGNLYQLLAYLRNRERTALPGPRHDGILLYPVVEESIAGDVKLKGFRLQSLCRWDCLPRPPSIQAPHRVGIYCALERSLTVTIRWLSPRCSRCCSLDLELEFDLFMD
jgi:hypothetical protein